MLLAPSINGIDKGSRLSVGRIAAAAVVGGTASKLSGGKFANGATTGAFSRMFNDEYHHQSVKSRVIKSGKKILGYIKHKPEELHDYAVDKFEDVADSITEKLRQGTNVKFDVSLTAGVLGVGIESTVTLAFSKFYEIGTFFTMSGGGFAGLGGGMNYSVGTWQGDSYTLEGFSGSVGGLGALAGKGDITFTPDGVGGDVGTGINVGYAAYGFVNHTWLIGREYL
ncbi:hypothetical protein [Pseudoalteromonas sp. MMG013]|uniref:hypothetical protein n=1 Tax=Pseudoalteromonas sp. MMG013 TaxID=2822687 RepID=UPI001B366597|nr:hypothetical protein [Pseudoalteromonas sp. MMG013]